MRQYPRTVWVLTPTFVPKAVEIINPYRAYSNNSHTAQYDQTKNGKIYHLNEMHESEALAIAHGLVQIAKQQKDLEGRKAKIEKRHANLMKAQAAMLNKEKQ